jgi:hypothetical protein
MSSHTPPSQKGVSVVARTEARTISRASSGALEERGELRAQRRRLDARNRRHDRVARPPFVRRGGHAEEVHFNEEGDDEAREVKVERRVDANVRALEGRRDAPPERRVVSLEPLARAEVAEP